MSSIKEDQLKKVKKFLYDSPSEAVLLEYLEWKRVTKSYLVESVSGLSFSERREICYNFYAKTLEYAEAKEIFNIIDQISILTTKVFADELLYLFNRNMLGNGEDGYMMCRYDELCILNKENMDLVKEYSTFLQKSRTPILNDIKFIIVFPDVEKRVMDSIPR